MFGNEGKDAAKMFANTLKGLEQAKKQLLNNLTAEQLKGVSSEAADLNRAMSAAKNGDTEELNKYVKKYANIN